MGTSSSSSGPGNNSPLLPNWAQVGSILPEPNIQPSESSDDSQDKKKEKAQAAVPIKPTISGNWGGVKSCLGRVANGSGGSLGSMGRSYVRNLGGPKNATKASRAGISGGTVYANFLGNVINKGLNQTLTDYGLSDCIGKTPEEIFAKLADKISPSGDTNEDAIARKALLASLETLYEKHVAADSITALESLNETDLIDAATEYMSSYIYYKWLYELGLAIENKQIDESRAIELEKEIKDFIHDEVKLELKNVDITTADFSNGKEKKIITDIFDQSYSTISA